MVKILYFYILYFLIIFIFIINNKYNNYNYTTAEQNQAGHEKITCRSDVIDMKF